MAMKAYRGIAMRDWKPWTYGIVTLVVGWLAAALFLAGGEGDGLVFLIGAPVVAGSLFWTLVSDRSRAFAKWAFAGGYAKSRKLILMNPRLFQAQHMRPLLTRLRRPARHPCCGRSDPRSRRLRRCLVGAPR